MSRLSAPVMVMVVVVLIFASTLVESTVNGDGSPGAVPAPARVYPDLWVSDAFYRALANFTVRAAENTACRQQSEMYEKNLQNYTSWAVRSK